MSRIRLAFDMETQDPDDALTLCLLASHPRVALAAISINPGTPRQVGVVRAILERLGRRDIPIGSRDTSSTAKDVSPFHERWLGAIVSSSPDATAVEVLAAALEDQSTVLLCGGPLHNVRALLDAKPDVVIPKWLVQGGFAGDDVVAVEHRLPKFAGKVMAESHNFGANKKATLAILGSPRVREKRLVSKNVTHGVLWDAALQRDVDARATKTAGVAMMAEAMRLYLEEWPEGKALHDPLAACAVIAPGILEWAEVEVKYEAGRWGAARRERTSTFISTAVDRAAFLEILLATA